jgi:hypothetical protein
LYIYINLFQASLAARQLIHGLLHRDPANRLGSSSGAHEIKQHPFFHGIKWPLLRDMVKSVISTGFLVLLHKHIRIYVCAGYMNHLMMCTKEIKLMQG